MQAESKYPVFFHVLWIKKLNWHTLIYNKGTNALRCTYVRKKEKSSTIVQSRYCPKPIEIGKEIEECIGILKISNWLYNQEEIIKLYWLFPYRKMKQKSSSLKCNSSSWLLNMYLWIIFIYSCDKITKIWIRISRQNWNSFYSNY